MHHLRRLKDVLPPWLLALFILTGITSVANNMREWRDRPYFPPATGSVTSQHTNSFKSNGGLLSFDLPDIGGGIRRILTPNGQRQEDSVTLPPELENLFEGESNSLVARAIGAAEGTRLPTGEKTQAYFGHVDPGNGVWNMGTFSYQHGAATPEEADRLQMRRLRKQGYQLHTWAERIDVPWGLEEQLNALDLANQAPLAALSYQGYLDRLEQAYEQGYRGSDAVLHARVYSYLDPETNQWNAPGLGNTLESIWADQQRRQQAVQEAIAASGSDG